MPRTKSVGSNPNAPPSLREQIEERRGSGARLCPRKNLGLLDIEPEAVVLPVPAKGFNLSPQQTGRLAR